MANSWIKCVRTMWKKIANTLLRRHQVDTTGPWPAFALDIPWKNIANNSNIIENTSVLKQILNDGFLWAVPRNRRSVERRLTRKMGRTQIFFRGIFPKRNLLICNICGHYHEAHTVCGNCWKRVREETEAMQETIQKELKLEPVEKEVIVLYTDDNPQIKNEIKNKKIIEMPKERPEWFSKNLLIKVNS